MTTKELLNNQINGNFDLNNICILLTDLFLDDLDQINPPCFMGNIDYLKSLDIFSNALDALAISDPDEEELYNIIPEATETVIQFAWAYKCLGNSEESDRLIGILKEQLPRFIQITEDCDPEFDIYSKYSSGLSNLSELYKDCLSEIIKEANHYLINPSL